MARFGSGRRRTKTLDAGLLIPTLNGPLGVTDGATPFDSVGRGFYRASNKGVFSDLSRARNGKLGRNAGTKKIGWHAAARACPLFTQPQSTTWHQTACGSVAAISDSLSMIVARYAVAFERQVTRRTNLAITTSAAPVLYQLQGFRRGACPFPGSSNHHRQEKADNVGVMQLRVARLCLDCEELHDAQQCPVCASQSFAYLTRWVPAPERRMLSRPAVRPNRPKLSGPRFVVGFGILGAAAFAFARWSKRARERLEATANRDSGELR